ncbi:MAG: flagellar basal-body MS-ring/collar protein FliF, partial [bacterium]
MSDFFKQLISQINDLWSKLSLSQKVITGSIAGLTFTGLLLLIIWANMSGGSNKGFVMLYNSLELEESASIVEKLKEIGVKYKIMNNGHSIHVQKKDQYEMRMTFAKLGLPKSGHVGYEIFDQTNLGVTDYVQKLNFKRAVEGELMRTIESLEEVKRARVHVVIPKETIFLEKKREPTASVVLKLKPGYSLNDNQIYGIANLISSSVEGLKTRNISILDDRGNLLTNTFGDNEVAEKTSQQMKIQRDVETHLANKVTHILDGVLGPGKVRVICDVKLNFNQVSRRIEDYDPDQRVIVSQQREEGAASGKPAGNENNESSITNFEGDLTVENIVSEVGNISRISVSAAIDGKTIMKQDGTKEYVPRTDEELQNMEELVKRAVGFTFNENRQDQVVVSNLQFDKSFVEEQLKLMASEEKRESNEEKIKWGIIALVVLLFVVFLKIMAKHLIEAMNPPVPEFVGIGEEEEAEE